MYRERKRTYTSISIFNFHQSLYSKCTNVERKVQCVLISIFTIWK